MRMHPRSFLQALLHYLRYDLVDEVTSFRKWVMYYVAVWIFGALVVVGLGIYLTTATQKTAVLGNAQLGSSYRSLAEFYRTFFERNGLHLELTDVSHIGESADQLEREAAPINASFILAGSTLSIDTRKLVSLGSIKLAPGWLFYRAPAIEGANPFTALAGRRISGGPRGSFSNRILRELYDAGKNPGAGPAEILELTDSDGTAALLRGDVDAVWMIDSAASDNVSRLISRPDIHLFSWELADAYLERLPYLSRLILPAGYFHIGDTRPAKDVKLLSSTVTLLVEADLHPALQWGFLLAAQEYYASHYDELSGEVSFPKYIDKSVPISSVAEQYFNEGVPTVFSYLPIFYASIVERIWIWLAGTFILGYPTFRMIKKFRASTSKWIKAKASRQKRRTERRELRKAQTLDTTSK